MVLCASGVSHCILVRMRTSYECSRCTTNLGPLFLVQFSRLANALRDDVAWLRASAIKH